MSKALLVTPSFLPGRGGIESYLAELCGELAPDIAVLAPAERDGKPLPDLPYETFGYSAPMVPTGGLVRAVDEAAQAAGADRIILGTPWPLALIAPRLSALGYPYGAIVYGAELLVSTAFPVARGLILDALAGADFVVSCSNYTIGRLATMLSARGRDLPPGGRLPARVDLQRFRPDLDPTAARAALGLGDGDRIVLCFGRLVTRKGIHRVIDVMPAISARVPNAVLVVAGAGPEEENLRRQAATSGARVLFAGRVPEDLAPALFAAADVFTLPVVDRFFGLEVEGLGVVMLEAAACGTPSVIGRSGGSPETVVDGETGFVLDARDRRTLGDRISYLLEHRDEASEMGIKARAFVEREFATAPLPDALVEWLARSSG